MNIFLVVIQFIFSLAVGVGLLYLVGRIAEWRVDCEFKRRHNRIIARDIHIFPHDAPEEYKRYYASLLDGFNCEIDDEFKHNTWELVCQRMQAYEENGRQLRLRAAKLWGERK